MVSNEIDITVTIQRESGLPFLHRFFHWTVSPRISLIGGPLPAFANWTAFASPMVSPLVSIFYGFFTGQHLPWFLHWAASPSFFIGQYLLEFFTGRLSPKVVFIGQHHLEFLPWTISPRVLLQEFFLGQYLLEFFLGQYLLVFFIGRCLLVFFIGQYL